MSWLGGNAKHLALGLLVLQNTSLVLLMRHSLTMEGPRYVKSTAVAMMEILKLSVCFFVVYMESGESKAFFRKLLLEVVQKPLEMAKLMVPALLYIIQNNLLYVALENLDAATYSVCYQTKILTTALFSVILLGRRLSLVKWLSLVLLMIGVALAELSSESTKKEGSEHVHEQQLPVVGFWCVVAAACTSGFAGVYFEMLLKGSKTSLWIRNIQMGLPSIFLALINVFYNDWQSVTSEGFFHGYNGVVLGVVLLQAGGGLVVAVVVKYTDNIRKSFAAAVSIIMSCIMSVFLFDFHPNLKFIVGAGCVCVSVFMYSRPPPSRGLPTFHKAPLATNTSEFDRRHSTTRRV